MSKAFTTSSARHELALVKGVIPLPVRDQTNSRWRSRISKKNIMPTLKSPRKPLLSDDYFFGFGVTTCCLFQGGLYKFLARQTCEGLIILFPDGDEVFSSLLWGGGFC